MKLVFTICFVGLGLLVEYGPAHDAAKGTAAQIREASPLAPLRGG